MIPSTSIPNITIGANKPNNPISPTKHARSIFDLTQSILGTINVDIAYPLMWEEIIPTDTVEINTVLGGRTATPLYPIMDNLWIQYDWWFRPYRIIWNKFVNFFGENELVETAPGSGIWENKQLTYLCPIIDEDSKEYAAAAGTIKSQGFGYNGLFNVLLAGNQVGVPMDTAKGNYLISALARMYMQTGYDWYWDQNYGTVFINDAGAVERVGFMPMVNGDGPDDASMFQLYKKGKKLDYFVRARPNIMTLADSQTNGFLTPLGAYVPIDFLNNGTSDIIVGTGQSPDFDIGAAADRHLTAQATSNDVFVSGPALGAAGDLTWGTDTALTLNLQNIGVAINNIRLYEVLQRYYERMTRVGQRYVEYAFGVYGARPEDSRLQLSEWLGGHTERLQYNAIAQTAPSSGPTNATGDLAAFGTLVSRSPQITKSFSEHGFIMLIATVFPDVTYQQGISRKLQRRTVHEFHDPLTENLTEQAVRRGELVISNDVNDNMTFGYVPRFSEMKEGMRKLFGRMRSYAPQTLDPWHFAQDLPTSITSNSAEFRTYDTDFDRTVAITSQPDLIIYGEANIRMARPMQTNPTPIIGGF